MDSTLKKSNFRIKTGSTMAQTGIQSNFFQENPSKQTLFPSRNNNFGRENNRYQNQEQENMNNDNQEKKQLIVGDDASDEEIQEDQQIENIDNQHSPQQKNKKGNDEDLYLKGQQQAISQLLVKFNLIEITQPYMSKRTQKCQCFQIKTQKHFDLQKQKEKLINLGKQSYDQQNQDHNNILYSINYNIHQTEKLSINYSNQIAKQNINLFQLLYTLSCTQEHLEEIFSSADQKKDVIIQVLMIISKYLLKSLERKDLDNIFNLVQKNGDAIHNCLTQIHVAIFSDAFQYNSIKDEQICQKFQNQQIVQIFQNWKNKKLQQV